MFLFQSSKVTWKPTSSGHQHEANEDTDAMQMAHYKLTIIIIIIIINENYSKPS